MFWGISLESGKRYSQTVEKSFHISMAALNSASINDKGAVTIMVEVEKACYPLCTLIPGKIPQQTLDYFFTEGEEVLFYTEGDQLEVHLTGYLADDPDPVEYSSSENESEASASSNVSEEEKESMENLLAEINDLNEDNDGDINMWLPRSAREKNKCSEGTSTPLLMLEEEEASEDESEDTEWQPGNKRRKKNDNEEETTPKKDDQKFSKSKKKLSEDSNKLKQNDESPSITHEEKNSVENDQKSTLNDDHHHEKRHLSGGVVAEDLVKGTGKKAKKGKHVLVYYKGFLKKTKKVFDQCVSGKPFKFKLGGGEVIVGWETGVEGMHVGGKRRLTIPPSQAYGSEEMGSIPANSTLVFIVELIKVL